MKETLTIKRGVTIKGHMAEPEIMEIPKGTVIVAENKAKGIRYEYVNTKSLIQADFEGERPTARQKELQDLILKEGFPYQDEVGNFWAGVVKVSGYNVFSCDQLISLAESFDPENGSQMGNIHQYALYLASRVKSEGWEVVADKADKLYKRYRTVKDHRADSGFSYVGGCCVDICNYPASNVMHRYNFIREYDMILVWTVLSK